MMMLVMLGFFGTIAGIFPARYAAAMHLSKPRMTMLENFRESPKGEVRRIYIPRTPLNRAGRGRNLQRGSRLRYSTLRV
jgi:hypothetical protein